MPFCFTGRDSGDPLTDDVCEAAGDAWGFSAISETLGVVTVAMVASAGAAGLRLRLRLSPRRWGRREILRSAGLGLVSAELESELSAQAVRAKPVLFVL